jgi:hypothetical protein
MTWQASGKGAVALPPVKEKARSRLFSWIRLGLLVLVSPRMGMAAVPADPSENDFKGAGLCRFALHGFVLAPQTEKAINDSVQKLLDQHRAVFHFQPRPDFRLRMRVFGRFEDYTNATFRLYWTNAADQRALQGRPFNVAGFYTSATKEIVTWRQQMPGFLGKTLLHEASHAIVDAHYEQVPLWLMEGAGDYFAFALHPPDALHLQHLRHRWTRLNLWRREQTLPAIESLLNADNATFKRLDPETAYTTSWSLFQLMMSVEANRQMMLTLLRERQETTPEPLDCAKQIERLYPGGLKRFEAAWHGWIAAGASVSNAPPSRSRN